MGWGGGWSLALIRTRQWVKRRRLYESATISQFGFNSTDYPLKPRRLRNSFAERTCTKRSRSDSDDPPTWNSGDGPPKLIAQSFGCGRFWLVRRRRLEYMHNRTYNSPCASNTTRQSGRQSVKTRRRNLRRCRSCVAGPLCPNPRRSGRNRAAVYHAGHG